MIVVRIELWRFGSPRDVKPLGSVKIWNDATGTATRGNYGFEVLNAAGKVFRKGEVKDFPRKALLAADLLYRVLKEAFGARN